MSNTPLPSLDNVLMVGTTCLVAWSSYKLYQKHHQPPSSKDKEDLDPAQMVRDMMPGGGGGKQAEPVIGRDAEIDHVIDILCCRTKNCAALVGSAGVGKTAIVEGLAQRIADGGLRVPAALAGARILEVDFGAMMSGTWWYGMIEKRVRDIISKAEASNGKTILFFDEMHMLYQSRNGTIGDLLKPALARGRIRCVGATTLDEYHKYIEKDAALERRFQKVHVEELTMDATIGILRALKQRYQDHYGLEIQDAALVAAANLAARYLTRRHFPDKAIDLIEQACSTTARNTTTTTSNKDARTVVVVGPNHVAQVLSRCTGIPTTVVDREEKDKLMQLADRLHERVIGQQEAIDMVAKAVLRSRASFAHPSQPIGSFLFLGSTGVGKTELAKALAHHLFGSDKMLVRLDMSEYVSVGSATRLVGSPPSYCGYDEGGQLTEKIKRRPYSVILLDEMEKAHPSTYNVFLQLLDDGILTDGKGKTVDFKNTIVIMTSNLGAEHLAPAASKSSSSSTMAAAAGDDDEAAAAAAVCKDLVMKQVQRHFNPELLNRLSEVVIFEPLSYDQLREVVEMQMKGVVARVADKGITLLVSDAALEVVLSQSHNPMYGARAIRRWVEKNVMTRLSEMLVKEEAGEGSTISIDDDKKGGLVYNVVVKEQLN